MRCGLFIGVLSLLSELHLIEGVLGAPHVGSQCTTPIPPLPVNQKASQDKDGGDAHLGKGDLCSIVPCKESSSVVNFISQG